MNITIKHLNAFDDNYIWIIKKDNNVIIVDPGQSSQVLDYLAKNNLNPSAILITHYHNDHTGGVKEIKQHYPNLTIYGSQEIKDIADVILEDQQNISVLDIAITAHKTAGHTNHHISYIIDNKHLFCGDALFSAGCGRVFSGDFNAMYQSMCFFKSLNDDIKVYPAHEYTLANLLFAQTQFKDNQEINKTLLEVQHKRSKNEITLPSTIKQEKQINPFLLANSFDEFVRLRKLKDCS